MCRRVDCSKCGRPTFAGCGAHVEQVLRDVSPADRLHCREEKPAAANPVRSDERRARFGDIMAKTTAEMKKG